MLAITTCLSSLDSLGVHRNERKTFQNISAELSRKQLFILSCVSVSVLKSVSADKNISFNTRFIRPWDTRFPTHKGRKYVIITSIRRLTNFFTTYFNIRILLLELKQQILSYIPQFPRKPYPTPYPFSDHHTLWEGTLSKGVPSSQSDYNINSAFGYPLAV